MHGKLRLVKTPSLNDAKGGIGIKTAEFKKPRKVRSAQPVTAPIYSLPVAQSGNRGVQYSALND